MTRIARRHNPYVVTAVCGLLLLAIAAVFAQTARHDFVNLDDDQYVFDNPDVARGLTPGGVAWAFARSHSSNWPPVPWLSHMLDCQLYGLHAGGHHATNVLLHAATTLLLLLVLLSMTGDLWPCALAAAAFAIHPLHVESVAWVAERKDVLSALMLMLTLAAYVRYVRRPFSLGRYLVVVALCALGLMAKPMLVTLPFVLLLLDYWPLGRWRADCGFASETPTAVKGTVPFSSDENWDSPPAGGPGRVLVEKMPLLALSVLSCVVTLFAQGKAIAPIRWVPFSWRIANAVVSYADYLGQLLYPARLTVLYPHPGPDVSRWKIAAAGLLLAGISLGAIAARRRYPWLLVGWLWYLGMLVPVIGLVQVGGQAMADRYMYLPQIGIAIAVVWSAAHFGRRLPCRRAACGIPAALLLAAWMGCAWQQTALWRNSETLWPHTLQWTSDNPTAELDFGVALQVKGKTDAAIEHYNNAIRILPRYAEAYNNLGYAMLQKGRLDDAIAHYQKAMELGPASLRACDNLGKALVEKGRLDEAIAWFEKALEIQPADLGARNSLGLALLDRGRSDEAMAQFQTALQFDPRCAEAYNNVGYALFRLGRLDEAIVQYEKALEMQPNLALAQNNLGLALQQKGRVDEALSHFNKALQLDPKSPEAHNGLGLSLQSQGKVDESAAEFQKAIDLKPAYAEAHFNLGVAGIQKGRAGEAIAQWQKAIEIKPDFAMAHNNLGNALFAAGRTDEAIAHYRKAVELEPGRADSRCNLGHALAGSGRLDEAVEQFRKVLALNPSHLNARRSLRDALYRQGKPAEAP